MRRNVENRLVSVSWAIGSTNHSMTFVFDGDGNRVRSTLDGTTTTFAGTHYEITGSSVTKYYYSGTERLAMRTSSGVRYIFGDHPSTSLRTCLGSASVTADASGGSVTRQFYKPYGETRSSGSVPTKYQFTGQYSYSIEIGLMYYVARFFDPQLGRFISADTIVPQPGSPLSWDRYLYVFGNPLKYTDPSGHEICLDDGNCYEKGKLTRTFKSVETHPIEFFLYEIFQSPLRGIMDDSPGFGQARGTYFDKKNKIYHPGVDLGKKLGTNVYAVADGVVVFADDTYDLGYTIVIEHDINGAKVYSVYAHLGQYGEGKSKEDYILVEVDDPVSSGTHIGEMGNTKGGGTIDIHLHSELRTAMNVDLDKKFPLNGKQWWINQDGGKSCSPWTGCWIDLGLLYGYDASYKKYAGR